jgi:GST-like protein
MIDEGIWETFPHLKRWVDEVGARPAVDIGRKVGRDLGKREMTEEEEKARREILFNQTSKKVRSAREAAAKAAT